MNKKRVNEWLLIAKDALEKSEIVENGKINKTYRGQISSFGAAVVMGSLPAAVAFFSEQGGSTVDRTKLLVAMYYCIFQEKKSEKEILDFVVKNDTIEMREKFTDAAIALKLAMNFFELVEKE